MRDMTMTASLGVAIVVALITLMALAGCTPRHPEAIAYGHETCAYCRMRIDDPRMGGAIVTTHGRSLAFDAAECLASYYRTAGRGAIASAWVSDFQHPGRLVPAERARYLRVPNGRISGMAMGRGIIAVAPDADAATLAHQLGGAVIGWSDVLASSDDDHMAAKPTVESEPGAVGAADVVQVSPTGAVRTVTDALRRVRRGGTVVVKPGIYREPTIIVSAPVTITGETGAVLDGEGKREIMRLTADSVTVRGLAFRDVGVAFTEDMAAIRAQNVRDCVIDGNHFERAFFGIYLAESTGCRVTHNTLEAHATREATSGNGIHLWHSRDIVITNNRIHGHRDGIYFEFVRNGTVRDNVSEGNLRYGLHFMYSDSCRYVGNTFRANGAGVAVMYTKTIEMTGNRFVDNRGSATYGLLLKEIEDPRIERNVFEHNTTGLMSDGTSRLIATHNTFIDNGWALRLDANTDDGRVTANNFAGNTFDVATNGSGAMTQLRGNYWSDYQGYDLNRDGVGDVPHHPVRLASVIVARNEPALILLRSTFLTLLDAAERVVPALTPETVVDSAPAMRWNR